MFWDSLGQALLNSGVAADLLPLAVGCLHCTVLQVTADPVCTYGKLKVGQCVCRGDLIAQEI